MTILRTALAILIGMTSLSWSAPGSAYLYLKMYRHDFEALADLPLGYVSVNPSRALPGSTHDVRYARVMGALHQLGMAKLSRIVGDRGIPGIDFSEQPQLSDTDLELFENATDLRFLSLQRTQITDQSMAHIAKMKNLESLYLPRGVTDAGLAQLAPLTQLRELKLTGKAITDEGLAHLMQFRHLESLDLHGTSVSDAGLNALAKLPLRILSLSAAITDQGMQGVGRMGKLRQLDLSRTQVTNAGLLPLQKLSDLHTLFGSPAMTSEGFQALTACKHLRRLDLTGTQIKETSLGVLAQLEHLEELALTNTPIKDAALLRLRGFRHLRILDLSGSQVTTEGWAELSSLRELEILSLSSQKTIARADLRRLVSMSRLRLLIINGTPLPRKRMNEIKEFILAPKAKDPHDQRVNSSEELAQVPGIRQLYQAQSDSELDTLPSVEQQYAVSL